ncbi:MULTISPECIES: hypothetical protein [Synechococcaceae]|uniref:hypothetical protein n=1 Tax=Synechococcaceae TaxID=1890426 RepID=UPI001F29A0C1|nr:MULTISPECIES: hypothetical protein [Synechococcaceae]MCT4363883.1 hypothetical protein [Candidatus Regnicoccus frigidus MAG-AL1]MCT4367184.1 hypothetical protein [Candidatus Regnicoccus frigidus MAG-AL2]
MASAWFRQDQRRLHSQLLFRTSPRLATLAGTALLLASCTPSHQSASWRIFPLQRQQPHDGLAVASQPDGYGLHLWLETDTTTRGVCRPRWLPDATRLFNGNGSAPFSSGLATRPEVFEAYGRRDVRQALRRELEALCETRAPRSRWEWSDPPRRLEELKVEPLPPLKEEDLLPDPEQVRQQEEALAPIPPQPEDN